MVKRQHMLTSVKGLACCQVRYFLVKFAAHSHVAGRDLSKVFLTVLILKEIKTSIDLRQTWFAVPVN